MSKVFSNGLFLLIIGVILAGTGMFSPVWADNCDIIVEVDAGGQCRTLYAGQHIDAGTVCVEMDELNENLVVTYQTNDAWEIAEVHLWVGADIADMPQTKKGSPIPGQFPYSSTYGAGTDTHTASFAISIESLGFSCQADGDTATYYVAAHAALQGTDSGTGDIVSETGWGDGTRFIEKGNWATYFPITMTCYCSGTGIGEGDPGNCETAFAYSGDDTTCFLQLDLDGDGNGDFRRWGWRIGPLGVGSQTFDIYAAAGQCERSEDGFVGTLLVVYDGSECAVTYTMENGFKMDQTHIYAGSDFLPTLDSGEYTVAPGQYTIVNENLGGVTTATYTINGLSGEIYVIAHAVVCWIE